MAYTFLRALGHDVGRSLVEPDQVEMARRALESARRQGTRIVLPVDAVVAESVDSPTGRAVASARFPADQMGLDIGPANRRTLRGGPEARAHDRVERTDGGVREGALCGRDARGGARRGCLRGLLGDRGRGHGLGRPSRRGRREDRLHLDGRRGLPGVPRGACAARRRGPHRLAVDDAHTARHRQLEDARDPRRGARAGHGHPRRAELTSRMPTWRCVRPSPRWPRWARSSPGAPSGSAPRTATTRRRAPTRGRSRRPCSSSWGACTILLGHSERRHELGEPDELINRKVRAVLGARQARRFSAWERRRRNAARG